MHAGTPALPIERFGTQCRPSSLLAGTHRRFSRPSKFDRSFSKNSDKLLAERQIFHPRGRGGIEHVDDAFVLGLGVRADDDGVFVAEFFYCIP